MFLQKLIVKLRSISFSGITSGVKWKIFIGLVIFSTLAKADLRRALRIQKARSVECASLIVDRVTGRVGRDVLIVSKFREAASVPQFINEFNWRYGFKEYAPNMAVPFFRRARGMSGQLKTHPDALRLFFYADRGGNSAFTGSFGLEFSYGSDLEKEAIVGRLATTVKSICDQTGCNHFSSTPGAIAVVYAEPQDGNVVREVKSNPDRSIIVDGTSFSENKAVHVSIKPRSQIDAKSYLELVWKILGKAIQRE